MSFLRLAIKGRIYSGFGVLVVLGLALAAFATWELSSIAKQVGKMTALNDNVGRALEVSRHLEIMSRANLRFSTDGQETALKTAAHTSIDQAVTAGKLTADQATTQKTQADQRIDQQINQVVPQRGTGTGADAETVDG